MTVTTITPKQQSFLKALLIERASVLRIDDVDDYIVSMGIDRLTTREASAVIDKIKSIPKPRKPEHAHLPEGHVIINKRNGSCELCGGLVNIGDGFAVAVNGAWFSYHRIGECFNESETLRDVECGYYALESRTGNNDLDFFVVHIKDGQKEVLRVIGGHPNTRMTSTETRKVAEALAQLTALERHESHALFGREIGRCGRCGRHLTDEQSRAIGLGAECASKL